MRASKQLSGLACAGLVILLPALAKAQSATAREGGPPAASLSYASAQPTGAPSLNADAPTIQAEAASPPAAIQDAPAVDEGGIAGYFANWMNRANQAQAEQPHWMTPLVTVTPRLEQEVRYDQLWEHLPNGRTLDNYGNGKGLELIPTTTNEVIFNLPAYEERQGAGSKRITGFGDYPFLLIKQRLFSENEEHGNAIVTAFLAVSAPTGSNNFTQNAWVLTPTLAGGKGFGDFDIQATSGVALPFGRIGTTGAQLLTNVALQYHVAKYFWPEVEFNDTIWLSGTARGGKDQLFITPGIILGRFVIHDRVKVAIGGGYQVALTPHTRTTGEILPTYDHNWLLSARLTF